MFIRAVSFDRCPTALILAAALTTGFASAAASTAAPVAAPAEVTRFVIAPGGTPIMGHGGRLMRFRVAVEQGIPTPTPAAFAAAVVKILSDPRSWTAGGLWRFQRVGPRTHADFTIYLVTPRTRERICEEGDDDLYTSCRIDGHVVINLDRWLYGVSNYPAPIGVYRAYLIDHETGHELGHGHVLCPGPGKPAPVMEQQTLGLHGCVPNSWPYPDGKYYTGRPGVYHDPIPKHP
ncbi:MAG: DUF3152 domain-containing protein [Gammaproteobacteria bacterium]